MRSLKLHFFVSMLLLMATVTSAQIVPPDFSVYTTHQDSFHLHEGYLEEDKVVLIYFFFTTCPPCMEISPSMENLYQNWGAGNEDVEFIFISNKSFDENTDVDQYANQYGFTFPGVGVDGGALGVWNDYRNSPWGSIFGTPAFIVIAPDESVQYDVKGATTQATLDSLNSALEIAVKTISSSSTKQFKRIVSTHYANGDTIQDVYANFIDYPFPGDTTKGLPIENGIFTDFLSDTVSESDEFSLRLYKDDAGNALKGISAFDILLIQSSILQFREASFFEEIAGDVNNDGKLSGSDIIALRRLILGLDQTFAQNRPVWEFYPDYIPENSLDSLQYDQIWEFPGEWNYAPEHDSVSTLPFKAVKIGDMNASWSSLQNKGQLEDRLNEYVLLNYEYKPKRLSYEFYPVEELERTYSFQFDIVFERAGQYDVRSQLPSSQFFSRQIATNTVRVAFYDAMGIDFNTETPLFEIHSGSELKGEVGISSSEWYAELHQEPAKILLTENRDDKVSVYPNPFHDMLEISVREPMHFTLRDIHGRNLRDIQLQEGTQRMDLSDLSPGQYILYYQSNDGRKFLIKQ